MLVYDVNNSTGNIDTGNQIVRRRSTLSSSNPNSDTLPIDCILVYNLTDQNNKDDDVDSNNGQQRKKSKTPSQRRERFEDYLCQKQGLIIKHIVSRMNI